jgi:hypothetical protein
VYVLNYTFTGLPGFFLKFSQGNVGNFGGDWAAKACSSHFAVEPEVQSTSSHRTVFPVPSTVLTSEPLLMERFG